MPKICHMSASLPPDRREWLAGWFSRSERSFSMKNPLDSLWGTVISGFVLTGILFFIVRALVNA